MDSGFPCDYISDYIVTLDLTLCHDVIFDLTLRHDVNLNLTLRSQKQRIGMKTTGQLIHLNQSI